MATASLSDAHLAKTSKVLMVGAGGIGCELLKTLVLSGFEDIEMIDLDTIDVSNLNRQFLFRKRHVGMSKAQVARESVLKFRPNAKIVAHHGNVKESRFDVDFLRRFDVVLNGLDNLEARKHVNRLCLAAEIPLVESGTTGYLGQVTVHIRGETACFECTPKPAPKSHPICTLRDTPDKPIHCIVYATDLLFPRLFSADPAAVGGSDLDEEDAVELSAFTREKGEAAAAFAARVFDFVFRHKISNLLTKEEMWEKRAKPSALPPFAELVPEGAAAAAAGADPSLRALTACKALKGLGDPQQVWSVADAARVFVSSAARILERDAAAAAEAGVVSGTDKFDKDDALAVEFVTATALLRSSNYGIPVQSLFDAKGMAGNIVHAVATTNAIVGGLIVIEALKVLRAGTARKMKLKAEKDKNENGAGGCGATGAPAVPSCCAAAAANYKYTFVKQHKSNNRLLEPIDPDEPNPKCVVCGNARLELVCDVDTMTLGSLLDDVLRKKIGLNAPEIEGPNTTLYLQDDDLDEDEIATYARNRSTALRRLPAGGVPSGTVLAVTDFSQSFNFELLVTHKPAGEWDEEEEPEGFTLRGDQAKLAAGAEAAEAGGGGGGEGGEGAGAGGDRGAAAEAVDDLDDVVIMDDDAEEVRAVAAAAAESSGKRKRGDDDGGGDGGAKAVRLD